MTSELHDDVTQIEATTSQLHEIVGGELGEVADCDGLRLGERAVLRRTLEVPTT